MTIRPPTFVEADPTSAKADLPENLHVEMFFSAVTDRRVLLVQYKGDRKLILVNVYIKA